MEKIDQHLIEHPIVSTITNEIPVIRSICNYWRETIRQSRETRVALFLEDIAIRISKLEENKLDRTVLDKTHIISVDFYNTIEQLTEYAARINDNSKIEYLKRFAVNYAKNNRPDIRIKDIMLGIVNQLNGIHFLILNDLYEHQKNLSFIDLKTIKEMPDREEIVKCNQLVTKYSLENDLLITVMYSLKNIGLIEVINMYSKDPYFVLEPLGLKVMQFLSNN